MLRSGTLTHMSSSRQQGLRELARRVRPMAIGEAEAAALDATEAVAVLRSGELGLREYVEALLRRTERLAHLGAYVTLDADAVLAAARRPDAGAGRCTGSRSASRTPSARPTCRPARARRGSTAGCRRSTPRSSRRCVGGRDDHRQARAARALERRDVQQRAHGPRRQPLPARPPHGRLERRHRGGGRGRADPGRPRRRHRRLVPDPGGAVRVRGLSADARALEPARLRPDLGHARHARSAGADGRRRAAARCRVHRHRARGATRPGGAAHRRPPRSLLPRSRPAVAALAEATLDLLATHGAVLVDVDLPTLPEVHDRAGLVIPIHETIRELAAYLLEHDAPFGPAHVIDNIAGEFERELWTMRIDAAVYREALVVHRPARRRCTRPRSPTTRSRSCCCRRRRCRRCPTGRRARTRPSSSTARRAPSSRPTCATRTRRAARGCPRCRSGGADAAACRWGWARGPGGDRRRGPGDRRGPGGRARAAAAAVAVGAGDPREGPPGADGRLRPGDAQDALAVAFEERLALGVLLAPAGCRATARRPPRRRGAARASGGRG